MSSSTTSGVDETLDFHLLVLLNTEQAAFRRLVVREFQFSLGSPDKITSEKIENTNVNVSY